MAAPPAAVGLHADGWWCWVILGLAEAETGGGTIHQPAAQAGQSEADRVLLPAEGLSLVGKGALGHGA